MRKKYFKTFISIILLLLLIGCVFVFSFAKAKDTTGYKSIFGVEISNIKIEALLFSRLNNPNPTKKTIEGKEALQNITVYISKQDLFRLPFSVHSSLSNKENTLYEMKILTKDNTYLGDMSLFGNTIIFKPVNGVSETYFVLSKHDWTECIENK